MKMDSETTSFWYKFFTEAGIPASDASSHAVAFTKHRIKIEMLQDLNKEYLNDMGVTMMGDVIAILKHAKIISQQSSRDQALKGIVDNRPQTPPRRSTPASRTVAHYLGKDEKAGPMNEHIIPTPKISQDLAARLGPINEPATKRSTSPLVLRKTIATRSGSPLALRQTVKKTTPTSPLVVKINTQKQKEVVPVPKSRRVLPEHEGKYKIKMPQGTTARTKKILERAKATAAGTRKSSVFDRLGNGDSSGVSQKFKVTGLDKIVIHKSAADSQESSVFQRLGGKVIKRAATSTVPDSSDTDHDSDGPEEQLEYQGVFKDSPPKKKIKLQRKAIVLKAKPEKTEDMTKPSTEGIFSPFSQHSKKPVTARLGSVKTKGAAVIAEAQTTTTTTTKPKLQLKKTSVEVRLGPPVAEKSVGSKGVFSRLGKQH